MGNDFELANNAFNLMSLQEREAVLKEFARLRYPSIADRFFEAVHVVVTEHRNGRPGDATQPLGRRILSSSTWEAGMIDPRIQTQREKATASESATARNLSQCVDAAKWAESFMAIDREYGIHVDEGTMLGWFANAIMAGYDHAKREVATVEAVTRSPRIWDCRICGFGVREGAALEWIRTHGEHYNAVSEWVPNNGTAYCPTCSDETLRSPL